VACSISYWVNYTRGKTKLSWKSVNTVADDRVLKFLYDADLTSCWILSAMSPEIQEWSHKSRSRINNLYLLTRPILTSLVAVYWYKSESVCMSLYTLAHRVWIWCSLCFRGWILTPFCLLSVGCWGPGHCMQTLFIVGRAGVVWSDGRQ